MFNPFLALRQRNILNLPYASATGAPTPPPPPPPTPPISTEPLDTSQIGQSMKTDVSGGPRPRGYQDDLMDLQNTSGPGIAAYKQYLSTQPNRDDYKPGIGRRIAAGLSGFAAGARNPGEGIKVASEIDNGPYADALSDYSLKGAGLKERAVLEQNELDSKIKALQDARGMGLKYDEYQLAKAKEAREGSQGQQNANANTTRAEAAWISSNKKNYDKIPQQDGSILWVNKENPSDTRITGGKSVEAGQLGVSRTNASTNIMNADTNRVRANIDQQNADTSSKREGTYEKSVNNRAATGAKPPLPRVQQDAEDRALTELGRDARFSDFISSDAKGFPIVQGKPSDPLYQAFLAVLKAKTQEILKGGGN